MQGEFSIISRYISSLCTEKATKLVLRSYRLESGIGNPSSFHSIVGKGFPVAMHFNDNGGPGCNVCSENEFMISGPTSVTNVKFHLVLRSALRVSILVCTIRCNCMDIMVVPYVSLYEYTYCIRFTYVLFAI